MTLARLPPFMERARARRLHGRQTGQLHARDHHGARGRRGVLHLALGRAFAQLGFGVDARQCHRSLLANGRGPPTVRGTRTSFGARAARVHHANGVGKQRGYSRIHTLSKKYLISQVDLSIEFVECGLRHGCPNPEYFAGFCDALARDPTRGSCGNGTMRFETVLVSDFIHSCDSISGILDMKGFGSECEFECQLVEDSIVGNIGECLRMEGNRRLTLGELGRVRTCKP